jgi:hypothetical protein
LQAVTGSGPYLSRLRATAARVPHCAKKTAGDSRWRLATAIGGTVELLRALEEGNNPRRKRA